MKRLYQYLLLLFLCVSFSADGQKEPYYSVYLIGDTGAPILDYPDPVLQNLEKRLTREGKNTSIVFLGDNIYHNGLPPQENIKSKERNLAEQKLKVQLKAIENFKGDIYFVPGNHDWNDAHPNGLDYIRTQEKFIETFLDRGDILIPDKGCPGPEKKKLGKNIVLIVLDSQWWLHPHTNDQLEKSTCKNKTTDQIIQELKEMLDEHDEDQIIIAFHHPLYFEGSHNGYYQLSDHIFPLRNLNKNLWIPLPGLGSLYTFYRSSFGAKQDLAHPLYKRFKEEINSALVGRKNIILASGHEHSLQYTIHKENHFIVSGSGSKSSPLPRKTNSYFSFASKGYAKLEYYRNGEIRLIFFIIEEDEEIEKFNESIVNASFDFGQIDSPYTLDPTPITLKASTNYEKGRFHKFIFGNLYRPDWSSEVSFRKLNLSLENGGLIPKEIGGGMSSRSIRLKSRDDKEYVLRSVEKGVAKVVPELFRNSVVQDIFQDQIAASLPYAALVVPPLADAAKVYHTNPEIVYLPEQPLLGDFNKTYGNQLYLYEERPSGNQEDVKDLGGSRKIISYSKMIENIRSSSKYHVHQDQVLRSRLLDIYLGDWDRHDDQWRWATFKERHHGDEEESHIYYEPIPRDRDQVMFKYQGFMPWISKLLSPELRKFQSFGPAIKNLKYLTYNARHFDRSYLNHLSRQDWVNISEEMSQSFSDSVIYTSINTLPGSILKMRNEEFTNSFKERRKKLNKWALQHYNFLAEYVDVTGTNNDELFQASRMPDGNLEIKVFHLKKHGKVDEMIFHREFYPGETKEVRLYGLDGADQFIVSGKASNGPLIRIIGGKGNDTLDDQSFVNGRKKSVVVYDNISDNGMSPGEDGIDKRSSEFGVNVYDRKEFYYNSSIGIPFIGFNPDDGLVIQYTHSLSTYGFRKSPYNSKHEMGFRYAFGSSQLSLNYNGQFVDVVGNADLGIDASLYLPENVSNFFGLTNVQTFLVSDFDDIDYFRYERTDLKIKPLLIWSSDLGVSRFQVGPYFRYVKVEENEGKFLEDFTSSGLERDDFNKSSYVGIDALYKLTKIDNTAYPTTGINFTFNPSYNLNLNNTTEKFSRIDAALTLYNYFWIPRPLVLASKIEGGINIGEFNFYQAQYIGLENGLRGFRKNRFGGKSSLLFTNDLRLKIGTTGGALPLTIGLIGSYDFGRVWNNGEIDTRWHQSYGGGFFISPFDIMPVSFYFLKSTENTSNFMFKLGFAL